MKPKILIFLLGLTGFGACGEKEIPVAYGVPTARFTIKGTVTDPAGNPLEGIRITPVEYPSGPHRTVHPRRGVRSRTIL